MNRAFIPLLAALSLLAAASAQAAPEAPADAAPTTVTVVDLKDADAAAKLAVVCLQGIVNRGAERPLLYCIHTPQDRVWFNQVYAARGFKAEEKTPAEAVARFADRIKGEVLYDPAQPETVNLATAVAGLEDALPATAATRDARRKVIEDLTRFKSRDEAARWAIESLLPRCNGQRLAILSEKQVALRDTLVSEKILPVGLDPARAGEAELLKSLLGKLAPGATLFWGERVGSPAETRALFARDPGPIVPALVRAAGKRLVPGADVGNLSFHARVPAFAPLRQYKRLAQHNPTHYVTFIFSGNGNLDFALDRMRTLWDDDARGLLPLGWEIHPLLAEMAPALLSYYYADAWWAGMDQFVMAPSGAGYLLPADGESLAGFLADTDRAARLADLTALSVVDLSAPQGEKPWPILARQPALRGFMAAGIPILPTLTLGKPLVGETLRVTDVEKAARAIMDAAEKQKFVLAIVDPATTTPTRVAQIASRLGREMTVVPPYYFLDLMTEHVLIQVVGPQLSVAKLTKVTFGPTRPGPEDPVIVKAQTSAGVLDARVKYNLDDGLDYTEPMVRDGDWLCAAIPPTLRGGKLTFKVRITDGMLRTTWSEECSLTITAPDTDGDSLSDVMERVLGLDPVRKDSDGDGLLDANDPAPLLAWPRPKDVEGPIITAIATAPRTPPAAGKPMSLRALVFDPSGVESVAAKIKAGERDLGGGEMKEILKTQVYEYDLPTLIAGQTLTVTLSATNGAGKASTATASIPVGVGVRITSPPNNTLVQKPIPIRMEVAGKAASVRVLLNGYEVIRLPAPPYQYLWDPAQYAAATHEVMVEALDEKDQLLDSDAIYLRVPPKARK